MSAPSALGQSEYVEVLVGPDPGPTGRVVIIAIHGLGDTPESFVNWLRATPVSARVLAVRGTESYGGGFAWWLPDGGPQSVARAIDRAAATIATRVRGKIDAGRCGKPIVLGFSQGAMVSFAIAARGSLDVGLVMPIGGGLPLENREVTRAAGMRPMVRAFHGEADERMPIVAARMTVEALTRQGMDATLRSFAGVGHSIPDEVRQAVFSEIERTAREGGCLAR
jgi:phospholipase/carboxylesterase